MRARTEEELIAFLLSKSTYDEASGCLIWNGCIGGAGYGVVNYKGKPWGLHRLAYHLEHPNEKLDTIMHTCDRRACWNLEHLVNGTLAQNRYDAVSKGRHAIGSTVGTSKLKEAEAKYIKYSKEGNRYLATRFEVSISTVQMIKRGDVWKHI